VKLVSYIYINRPASVIKTASFRLILPEGSSRCLVLGFKPSIFASNILFIASAVVLAEMAARIIKIKSFKFGSPHPAKKLPHRISGSENRECSTFIKFP